MSAKFPRGGGSKPILSHPSISICSQDIEWIRNSDINQGHNSVTNLQKMTANNPNLDLVNINFYILKPISNRSVFKLIISDQTQKNIVMKFAYTCAF